MARTPIILVRLGKKQGARGRLRAPSWIEVASNQASCLALVRVHSYGCGWPVHTLSKQIGHVTAEQARSVAVGQPVAGVGLDPSVAVALVTRTVSVNP